LPERARRHDVRCCAGLHDSLGQPSSALFAHQRFKVDEGKAALVADKLNFPNGIAVGSDNTLYVSANSICPAGGGPAPTCGFMGQTSGLLLKIAPASENDD
jgi:hypothetical protein